MLPFLNYGRLYNAVRAQDAVFQQSLVTYKQTVLQALQEAENAMSSFIRSRQRLTLLQQAAEAAGRSTKLALEQYNAGSTDFTTVVSAQTTQYQQENSVAAAAGNTALQAVALFRALGGGWQPQPLPLPKATIDAMKKRTDWGGMLRDMESVPRCRAVRDPTSRNAQRLLICTAATPKHPFAKTPPACPRSSFPDCRDRCGLLPCSGRLQRHAA